MYDTTSSNFPTLNETGQDETKLAEEEPYSSGKVISDQDLFIIKATFNAILTQGFCVFGSITNVINILVFYRIGYTETINITLTALAVSDFGSCFILIWRNVALNPWFQQLNNLPFETNEISYLISLWPHIAFVQVTKLLTAFISVERCLCVTKPLKVKSIITKTRVKIFCIASYIVVITPFIPLYFTHKYDWKYSPFRNKTLIGLVFTQNVVQVNNIVYPLMNVIFSQIPFVIITLSTIFLVISLRKSSKWRQKMKAATSSSTNDASKSATSTSTKETKVSKMVVMICVLFIASFLPYAVSLVVQDLYPELSLGGRYTNSFIMMGAVIFFFECLNSSCNIFIYYRNSSVYKTTFDEMFRHKKIEESEKI